MRLSNKSIDYWLRERDIAKENSDLRFGLGFRSENEKIQNQILVNSVIDHAKKDNQMIHYPDWKKNKKNKWIAKKDFNNKTLLY